MQKHPSFRCVVLAGERPGGSELANAFGVDAGVLVPVAGRPTLTHVLEALAGCDCVGQGVVCGPALEVVRANRILKSRLDADQFPWLEPAAGPAASALAGVKAVGQVPVLVTAGDHALLTPSILKAFCDAALAQNADVVVGLVPFELVQQEFPSSRRTVLRFADGGFCGSNLFAMLTERGQNALRFWSRLETDRKKPWRIARKLGLSTAIRYLLGRLTSEQAFSIISAKMNCRVMPVTVPHARAAVDVDSPADQALAETILARPRSLDEQDGFA